MPPSETDRSPEVNQFRCGRVDSRKGSQKLNMFGTQKLTYSEDVSFFCRRRGWAKQPCCYLGGWLPAPEAKQLSSLGFSRAETAQFVHAC